MRNAHLTIFRIQHTNVIPTICFAAATPSNAGLSFQSNAFSPRVSLFRAKNLPLSPENSMFSASHLAQSRSSRKRLAPKKSKLGLLGGSQLSQTSRERDLSDVACCVGANSSPCGGLDIYVDPREDHETGEIIMVKKKKVVLHSMVSSTRQS
jgi:serine/arginine repetitive matrix protein 2